jgi:anti-sigma factor RsiW
MQRELKTLSQAHLHAYADRELIDPRRVEVADFVKTHPNFIIYIRDYEFINQQLHKLYDGVLSEPVPKRLTSIVKKHKAKSDKRANKLFIILIGMLLGGVIGVLLHQSTQSQLMSKAKVLFETFISRMI